MSDVLVRPARPQDMDAIMRIQEASYSCELVEARDVFQSMLDTSWVACSVNDRERVLGFLLAHPWHDLENPPRLHRPVNDAPTTTSCYFLHDLSVDPRYRGRGIAAMLVGRMREARPELPLCLVAVNGTANPFWKAKHGFEAVPCGDPGILESYADSTATYMLYLRGSASTNF